MSVEVHRLGVDDAAAMRDLNAMFAIAFGEPDTYVPAPSDDYLRRVLGQEHAIVLAAKLGEAVVGGLVAYILDKLEQERSEIYIYDLAVSEGHRRLGVATALIAEAQRIAAETGAWMLFIQANYGDGPAIALYDGLGAREDVLHFDIPPAGSRKRA